jgi:hypothetical protein
VKIPIQKIKFPNVALPFKKRLRLSCTKGICIICRNSRYPLSFLKRHHMTSSCTQALRKKVMRVAVYLLTFIEEMDE